MFSDDQVREFRRRIDAKELSMRALAREQGVNPKTIFDLHNYITYWYVK